MFFITKMGAMMLQKSEKPVAPMPHKTKGRDRPDIAKNKMRPLMQQKNKGETALAYFTLAKQM